MAEEKLYTYKYTGSEEIHIPQVSTFKPGETKEVRARIVHPDFEEIKGEEKKKHK